jgi:hypothetical protein
MFQTFSGSNVNQDPFQWLMDVVTPHIMTKVSAPVRVNVWNEK